ncbi:hypothetical protein EIP91_006295 [Steccherinum ochraceum]|uniref:Major facilitator superfamily (MFS) profile domain-containing protein n=1 Tax=Steccherinum ochraceum TaxID=92696 RepID=A0A4R0RVB6_9APHY|nr:hypothetical protein EIP91_006295 [Steccherinum ochraceum]
MSGYDSQMSLATTLHLEKKPSSTFQLGSRTRSTDAVHSLEGDQELALQVTAVVAAPSPQPEAPVLDKLTAKACLTIAGAWMVQFCTFGYVYAFGVYQDYYTREFLTTSSPSDISWIGSLQLFLMYAPGVLVGRAFDGGYFHHVEIGGALLYVFSIFMLSLTERNQYYQVFLAQAVGMGLGLGLTFLPSLSIVSHHFRARRALATGIVVTGASAGGIVFPIMLNHLFSDPRIGFATGVRASGGLIAGMLLLANMMMRTSCVGLKKASSLKWETVSVIAKDGAYLISIAGAFFTSLGVFIPFDRGIDQTVASYSLTILNAGSTAGRLLPPFLADKLGVYNILLPSILSAAALLFAMFGVKSSAGVVTEGLLFGFFSGAYVSLIPPLLAALSPNLNELGLRMGFAFTVVAIAMLTGNPIAGALIGTGRTDGGDLLWWRAIVFAGVSSIGGFMFMLISRTLFVRRKGHQKV